jgi:N-methylhydantoinase A
MEFSRAARDLPAREYSSLSKARMPKPEMRIAADIGGTFTDVVALDPASGRLMLGKSVSTPKNLVSGISGGVAKAGVRFDDAGIFLHGATIVINTILERSGARTALLTTAGFRDIYEIGRINRPDAYNLYFRKHEPLVRRSLRFEIRERVSADGEIHIPLDEASVHNVCDRLKELGIEAVAIMLLHSYRHPEHERRVKEIVAARLPQAFVSASHELTQEFREFERTSTVVANAYVGPRVKAYLSEIDAHLASRDFVGSFLLMQSSGGLYESAQAKSQCIRILESGPAAGVIGAQALCEATNISDAIAFDMGGTTAKAGVICKGEALTTGLALVGGYEQALPIQMAMIDVCEVGTGGGSIAFLDEAGALRVGPRSAGAEPGPACYGHGGTRPTVTDANLVLGRLAPDRFLGGEMKLDREAARRAIVEHIAQPLGFDLIEAADGILRIAATAMSYAVKGVSTERGLDAASFPLIAYGGAGPLHAAMIAREIGMDRVIVPRAPGHFCAFGMLFSDLRYDYVRTWPARLANVAFEDMEKVYGDLVEQGRAALAKSGAGHVTVKISYAADMRYMGQEHAVTIDLPAAVLEARDRAAIKAHFDDEHQRRYGTSAPAEPAEIVSLRVIVRGEMQRPPLEKIPTGDSKPPLGAECGARAVYFTGHTQPIETPAYRRDELQAGNRIEGPALIEEHASTTLLFPGDRAEIDSFGNIIVAIGEPL